MNLLATTLLNLAVVTTTVPNQPISSQPVAAKERVFKTTKVFLKKLTPQEQKEFIAAYQKAIKDPAVQTTRQMTRIALHKAMLRVDPSIESIMATMDAHGPLQGQEIPHHCKSLGGNFDRWLANFPSSSVSTLTTADLQKLRHAHDQALLDPSVEQRRKDAHLIFYNAMLNTDPLIGPVLAKAGIATPSSIQPLSKNSKLGSEERILGGNVQVWGEEVLAPEIESQDKVVAPSHSLTSEH